MICSLAKGACCRALEAFGRSCWGGDLEWEDLEALMNLWFLRSRDGGRE